MNHIASKNIRYVRLLFILYGLHFLGGYFYVYLTQHTWKGNNVYTPVVVVFIMSMLAYEVFAQIKMVKNRVWLSTLITMAFILFATYATIENTGVFKSPYIFALLGILFMAGSLGVYWPIGIGFVLIIRYSLIFTGAFKENGGGALGGLIIVIFAAADALISTIIWRPHYKISENSELAALTKMLGTRNQQAEILIKSIADGVIVSDIDGKINLMNSGASALTEWTLDDAFGINIHLVVKLTLENGQPLQGDQDPFILSLTKKQAINKILAVVGRNNKHTTVSLTISPVLNPQDHSVAGLVAVFRDITEQRRQEQQRVDFISTASHEMRTPVAAIEGYLSLAMNDKVSSIDSKARGYLDRAYSSTRQLSKLFQDLLTSSKAEDGRLSNHPVIVEMSAFLSKLTEDFRLVAQKKNLLVDFNVNTDTEQVGGSAGVVIKPLFYTRIDPDRMREVVTNLFDNAVKYTETGRITIGMNGNDQIVHFFIQDTGLGIPTDDIPHLFQKFYRVDNSAVRTIGGVGLGLFICKKIVELYNGKIWVESEVGKGSKFNIDLPRIKSEQAEAMQSSEAAQNSLSLTEPLKV